MVKDLFNNLSLFQKITIPFALIALIIISFGIHSTLSVNKITDKTQHAVEVQPVQESIRKMIYTLNNDQLLIMEMISSKNAEEVNKLFKKHKDNKKVFLESLKTSSTYAEIEHIGHNSLVNEFSTLTSQLSKDYENIFLKDFNNIYEHLLFYFSIKEELKKLKDQYDDNFHELLKNTIEFEIYLKSNLIKGSKLNKYQFSWADMSMELKTSATQRGIVVSKLVYDDSLASKRVETIMQLDELNKEMATYLNALKSGGITIEGKIYKVSDSYLKNKLESLIRNNKELVLIIEKLVNVSLNLHDMNRQIYIDDENFDNNAKNIAKVLQQLELIADEEIRYLNSDMLNYQKYFVITSILLIILTVIASWLMGRFLASNIINELGTEPANITKLAKNVSTGNLKKALENIDIEKSKGAYNSLLKMVTDLKTSRDIIDSHQKELEDTVKQKTEEINKFALRMKDAQSLVKVGNWEMYIDKGTAWWSEEIFNIFGLKYQKSASFEKALESIHPDDRQDVLDTVNTSIEKNTDCEVKYRIIRPDGEIRYIYSRAHITAWNDGKPIKLSGALQDISELKKAEQIALEAKRIAEQATKAKSEFLANMSHEIRTPLNAILGFLNLLKEEDQGRKSLEYINIIDSSSNNLLKIIEDILDLSKIESGKLDIDKTDFNTEKEFKIVADLFNAKAKAKGIILSLKLDNNIPKAINTDSLRIKQIISNLISNAIKFTDSGKKIDIDISYHDENLHVSVKDEGKGIAKEKLNKIFESFSQEDSSTTREYGGTGLGLSISSELVKLLGGELKVKSEVGKGSEFYFSIPVGIGQNINKIQAKPQEVSFEGKKILLVEDNPANQMFMKIVLEKLKIKFDVANDGLEAIEAFRDNKYDAILMDENMPNMNGIEATKQIIEIEKKQNLKHTPIIALTANAIKGDRERFLKAGMDEYLTKPLAKEKLVKVINKLL